MRLDGYRWKILAGALCTAAMALWIGDGLAQPSSKKKVQATATCGPIDSAGKQAITLTLVIEKNWHIYANPIHWEGFESLSTLITAKSKVGPARILVQYPAGRLYIDPDAKARFMVYDDTVRIPLVVSRTAGDGPLTIHVDYCACDAKNCMPKAMASATVP